jgi:hypothetical protein
MSALGSRLLEGSKTERATITTSRVRLGTRRSSQGQLPTQENTGGASVAGDVRWRDGKKGHKQAAARPSWPRWRARKLLLSRQRGRQPAPHACVLRRAGIDCMYES